MKKAIHYFLFKIALIVALFLIIDLWAHAQTGGDIAPDTSYAFTYSSASVVADTVTQPRVISIDQTTPAQTWLTAFCFCIGVTLSGVQFMLKRIPTATSVKIGGPVGAFLDFVTFFQRDKSNVIKNTAPPPVQNGIQPPTLSDFKDHK